MNICVQCGVELTKVEHFYYEYRCEDCESKWSDRLTAFRLGTPDEELDELFSEPRTYRLH